MFGRQMVCLLIWVILDDLTRDHCPQPFADISFVQTGGFGNLTAGGRWQNRHCIEQFSPVADAGHQRQRSAV